MYHAIRFADPQTQSQYPLPARHGPQWRSVHNGYELDIPLPSLPPGHILVPSLSFLDKPRAVYRCALHLADTIVQLQAVPARTSVPAVNAGAVTTHIDCFHTHAPISNATLRFTVSGRQPPHRYLVTATTRALYKPHIEPVSRSARTDQPPPLSQMTARTKRIRGQICSPTATAMVLKRRDASLAWMRVVRDCLDGATGMYGSWPLAIRAAARRGVLGAVEALDNASQAVTVLESGLPLVASIRFADGGLPGAPLNATGGHLVVLFSYGPDQVGVLDPAAPSQDSVAREYPTDAFLAAWLQRRGAAYILMA